MSVPYEAAAGGSNRMDTMKTGESAKSSRYHQDAGRGHRADAGGWQGGDRRLRRPR